MSWFRVEIYDEKGQTIEKQFIELPQQTVEEALTHSTIIKRLQVEAKRQGNGFRIMKESE